MKFNIGEKVSFLHEKGGGIVRKIDDKGQIWVEDDTSFERPFKATELAKIEKESYNLDALDESEIQDDETLSTSNMSIRHENLTGRRKAVEFWEIDLHVEELTESHARMSNFEILQKQMTEFRSFFNKAQNKHIRKLIVIHGVGEGVLKLEIRSFLAKKDNIEFHDADFRDYGKGATEILIHYN